jgi:hypothetical protein
MKDYSELSLSEVIDEVSGKIEDHLESKGSDLDYPDHMTDAIMAVIGKANDYAAGDQIVGFAVASSFLDCLVQRLKVQLPEGLSDRLHERLTRD